jgi:hypothetical protein
MKRAKNDGGLNPSVRWIDSSFTSQTSDKLPNPERCERVNDAEPSAAMNDSSLLITAF